MTGVGSPPLAARDLVYLLLIPLTRIGMTLFPTSLVGQRLIRTGVTHCVFAIAAFTLTYLVISEMTPVLRGTDPRAVAAGSDAVDRLGGGTRTCLGGHHHVPAVRKILGLFERLFLLTTNLWFVLVAILGQERVG